MRLNTLFNNPGSKKDKKRVGRGIGTGKGKTCGRGVKGQKSRSGVAIKGFEGGQMPLIKRLPKRGFNCPSSIYYQIVNVVDIEALGLEKRLDTSNVITKESLFEAGFIKSLAYPVKLLAGGGNVEKSLFIKLDAYSKAAKDIVEKAGGKVL